MSNHTQNDVDEIFVAMGRYGRENLLPIIGEKNLNAFADWLSSDYSGRRVNMFLLEPEEAGRAFFALRYERWK